MNRRICTTVIKAMLAKIPETETELIAALEWNYEDASYKAPEENIQWIRTMETLDKYMPKPLKEDWQYEIVSIFTTHPISILKQNKL